MGEGDWFSQFCGPLRINAEKRGSISYRTGRIVGQLNYDLRDRLDSKSACRFYVGSYGRSTAIPSVSDVDLLYELPYSLYQRFHGHAGNGQSALLALVRNSIRNTYKTSGVSGDGQVVVINFDDGIRFEILPAFVNDDGNYTFADSNGGGSWRVCKPKHEMNAFSARNVACNQNLVELSRMARAWRDTNNVSMSGMLVDTLAYQFIAAASVQFPQSEDKIRIGTIGLGSMHLLLTTCPKHTGCPNQALRPNASSSRATANLSESGGERRTR
jgi:hypothetical protein